MTTDKIEVTLSYLRKCARVVAGSGRVVCASAPRRVGDDPPDRHMPHVKIGELTIPRARLNRALRVLSKRDGLRVYVEELDRGRWNDMLVFEWHTGWLRLALELPENVEDWLEVQA